MGENQTHDTVSTVSNVSDHGDRTGLNRPPPGLERSAYAGRLRAASYRDSRRTLRCGSGPADGDRALACSRNNIGLPMASNPWTGPVVKRGMHWIDIAYAD
jgi:hypothetical protein